jgi:hypothetical protein
VPFGHAYSPFGTVVNKYKHIFAYLIIIANFELSVKNYFQSS